MRKSDNCSYLWFSKLFVSHSIFFLCHNGKEAMLCLHGWNQILNHSTFSAFSCIWSMQMDHDITQLHMAFGTMGVNNLSLTCPWWMHVPYLESWAYAMLTVTFNTWTTEHHIVVTIFFFLLYQRAECYYSLLSPRWEKASQLPLSCPNVSSTNSSDSGLLTQRKVPREKSWLGSEGRGALIDKVIHY